MSAPETGRPEPDPDASVDDIQADIEATRSELGETVGALSAKLDVKHQAQQKVDHTKEAIADRVQTVRSKGSDIPTVPVAALALVALILGVVIWRRRR
jgi:hypothetical protein